MGIIEKIGSKKDLQSLSADEMCLLACEIRTLLLEVVNDTGGHLASNLGVVELTLAVDKVFSSPQDQILFDVGHQSYTHKIITGRREQFATLRTKGGLSGFPKRMESMDDAFIGGHSSTSLSAGLGLAYAKKLKGEKGSVVCVVGDGAMTGGMIYEAINNVSKLNSSLVFVLNDNEMSISKNVGSLAKYLSAIRSRPEYFKIKDQVDKGLSRVPLIGQGITELLKSSKMMLKDIIYKKTFFEDMGFDYYGPVDGHDIPALVTVFTQAKRSGKPAFVHVHTVKGKGMPQAEQDPSAYHAVCGNGTKVGGKESCFSEEFGKILVRLADENDRICAITAAMKQGTGLSSFEKKYPKRFFDIGIAEGHGVTFAAGLAAGGMIPVFAVYSTFLQRGYDQLIHDCSIEKVHAVFAIDRAGIVGEDGETHQGMFDTTFLSSVPGITVYSPCSYEELESCLYKAVYEHNGVVAVRYPRGGQPSIDTDGSSFGSFEHYRGGIPAKLLLVGYGRLFEEIFIARNYLLGEGVSCDALRIGKIIPLDKELFDIAGQYDAVLFCEEQFGRGSIGESFAQGLLEKGFGGRWMHRALEGFVPQQSVSSAFAQNGLDAQGIVLAARELLKDEG